MLAIIKRISDGECTYLSNDMMGDRWVPSMDSATRYTIHQAYSLARHLTRDHQSDMFEVLQIVDIPTTQAPSCICGADAVCPKCT